MFRNFKRHYHTTKRAYLEAVKSNDGKLGFNISHKQGEPVLYKEDSPDRDKVARFATLVYKFLDEKSELHYQKILKLIKSDFPRIITKKDVKAIEKGIEKIEKGMFPISINEEQLTAKQIFKIVAEAGYFERSERSEKFFADIAKMPLVHNLFWFQFKSHILKTFPIISVIFDLITKIENHKKYKQRFQPKESAIKKCIYCLSETQKFSSEEHILPETLAGDQIYLPKGVVCDTCNNGISSILDEALINFEPIALLRVLYTPYTKKGKFPSANFQNMLVEKTDPNFIKFNAKDRTGEIKNIETLSDGREKFNFSFTGKKLTWQLYARTVYKFALGFVAFDIGHEAALNKKYDKARNFILNGGSFNNNMFVSTQSKPHHQISTYLDLNFGGTQFLIDIFGTIFKVNLEEMPKLVRDIHLNEVLNYLSPTYEFDLISLK